MTLVLIRKGLVLEGSGSRVYILWSSFRGAFMDDVWGASKKHHPLGFKQPWSWEDGGTFHACFTSRCRWAMSRSSVHRLKRKTPPWRGACPSENNGRGGLHGGLQPKHWWGWSPALKMRSIFVKIKLSPIHLIFFNRIYSRWILCMWTLRPTLSIYSSYPPSLAHLLGEGFEDWPLWIIAASCYLLKPDGPDYQRTPHSCIPTLEHGARCEPSNTPLISSARKFAVGINITIYLNIFWLKEEGCHCQLLKVSVYASGIFVFWCSTYHNFFHRLVVVVFQRFLFHGFHFFLAWIFCSSPRSRSHPSVWKKAL